LFGDFARYWLHLFERTRGDRDSRARARELQSNRTPNASTAAGY
jgi:hypothetical protein